MTIEGTNELVFSNDMKITLSSDQTIRERSDYIYIK
jgi:hypothetical protein